MSDRSCCVNCKFFLYSPEDPGYSEYTPGSDASMCCIKSHWSWYDIDSQKEFKQAMQMSLLCKDFEPVKA